MLKQQFLRNIGEAGSTDTDILSTFNINLGQRYQLMLSKMGDYMTQQTKTTTTVVDQQSYHYPVGVVNIESATVNFGGFTQPLDVINSQHNWDVLNSIQIQASAITQFIFPRRDDFQIWPIPQDEYTLTFNYHLRDRDLSVEDYTTGTVTVTNNSQTVTGSGTSWNNSMIGSWFSINNTSLPGQGYWYRVSDVVSTTSITLETSWEGESGAGNTYIIGQVPEIPNEGHICLVDGVTADYYAGPRKDATGATWFENKFWTGSGNNSNRGEGDPNIKAGVIGLVNLYSDRNNSRIISRRPRLSPLTYAVWGTTLT